MVAMTSTSTSRPAEEKLSPSRIQLARERRGMTKVALATELGVTTRLLQFYETEGAPAARADDLARALDVHPSFFLLPEREAVGVDQGFFRALRRATAGQLTASRATASIGAEFYDWLAKKFTLPQVNLPDLDGHDPEVAASAVRAFWGRGEEALPNLIQLSEAHGVRVLSLPSAAKTVDAFSFWLDGRPHVFLTTEKSAERSRFDLAHELGHLVMHSRHARPTETSTREIEREADTFASAFLMPRRTVLPVAGREPAVPQILALRSHFRVSAMAMTRRLHDVGRLSDWGYRQNCVQFAQRGFRSGEPGGIDRERSRVFDTVFALLREQGTSVTDAGRELGLPPTMIQELTFAQVLVPMDGGATTPRTERAPLRLVR